MNERISVELAKRQLERDLDARARISEHTGCSPATAKAVLDCMKGCSAWCPVGYTTTIVGNPGEELTEHRFVGPHGTYIETF